MRWPFAEWHRLAVRHLGLTPREFWNLPLSDWLDLIRPRDSALDRERLNTLMKDYPDE